MNREDIAKRFELPERRSKIASLLKQDQEEVYCVCRSSDSSRFMIACDHCEEWYHGDCIDVTERQARHIKRFYCQRCRTDNPQLRIRYKTNSRPQGDSKTDTSTAGGGSSSKGGHSHRHHRDDHRERHRHSGDAKNEPCGTCRGCRRSHDCGKCSACCENSTRASGGDGGRVRKRTCKRRQCELVRRPRTPHVSSPIRGASQSAGADSVSGTKDLAAAATTGAATWSQKESSSQSRRPARASSDDDDDLWQPPSLTESKRNHQSRKRRHIESDDDDDEEDDEDDQDEDTSRKKSRGKRGDADGTRRDRLTSSSGQPPSNQPRQCYGPQCVQTARANSRYCSDHCGLSLARNRIFQVLPQRIQEWNMTRCVAEEHNTRTLELIRRRQLDAQSQLERLSRLHAQLDRLVERGRRLAVDPTAADVDDEDEASSLHCVTCGHEVSRRLALRHMERCYAKHESQTSFGSLYQTRVEGFNMFCDYYQAATGTYCKRLRVLCPEHCKNPKVGDDESCGCPLLGKNFDPNGQVCRVAKKKCNKHVGWEKLRRAELDMERVRWAMKMDDLIEQERQCRQSMADRAGVLSLMLHSTYDHEIMEKVQNQQRKMAKKSQMHTK